jgi:dihydrofolate reductase
VGKLVVTEFVTLDGVIEDPGGSENTKNGGWTFKFDRGPEAMQYKHDELMASDAQLLGRVTYEGFASAWPTMEGTGDFGTKMNDMPKFVVSQTLRVPEWNNTTVLAGDLVNEVGELKERFAGDILVAGSATLARSLLANGLVDEIHLMLFPVVLGSGKRLFADNAEPAPWSVVEAKQSGAVVNLTLQRAS